MEALYMSLHGGICVNGKQYTKLRIYGYLDRYDCGNYYYNKKTIVYFSGGGCCHADAYKFKITDLKDEYILLFYNSNIDFVIPVVNKKEKYLDYIIEKYKNINAILDMAIKSDYNFFKEKHG